MLLFIYKVKTSDQSEKVTKGGVIKGNSLKWLGNNY